MNISLLDALIVFFRIGIFAVYVGISLLALIAFAWCIVRLIGMIGKSRRKHR